MKTSFKTKIYKTFLLCFTITLLGSAGLIFGVALPAIYNSNLRTNHEYLRQMQTTIETYIRQINSLCIQASYTSKTRSVMGKKYNGNSAAAVEYSHDIQDLYSLYQDFLLAFDGVEGIFVYNYYNYMYYYSTKEKLDRYINICDESWYEALQAAGSAYHKIVISGLHTPPQFVDGSKYISLYRNIRDLNTLEINGKAEILIRPRGLRALLTSSDRASSSLNLGISLVDNRGTVICSTGKYSSGDLFNAALSSRFLDTKSDDTLTLNGASVQYSDYTGWYLVLEYDSFSLLSNARIMVMLFSFFTLLALVIIIIWGNNLSKKMTRPILTLTEGVSNLKKKYFDYHIDLSTGDEFEELAQAFNDMSASLKTYITRIYEVENQKSEAQMIALQAQINPHFTLNTINSVKHMAMLQGSAGIVSMLDDFELLLSAAFRFPNELITLREELNRIRAFGRIQEINSFGKIKLHLEYKEEDLEYQTIGLILQPLVENAIFHGIKPRLSSHQLETGSVLISLTTKNQDIYIHVKDDGVGMTKEKALELLSGDASTSHLSGSGIGVKNVNARIRLRFGENYGLSITTAPQEGCDVLVHLPKLENH